MPIMRKVQISKGAEPALQVMGSLFCAACTVYIMLQVQSLPQAAQRAMLVIFQPVVPPIVLLWLWGARVKGFKAAGVEYELCYALKDRKHLMPGGDIQVLALLLASITAGLAALMCKMAAAQAYTLTEMVPILLYFSLFAVAFLPWPMPHPGSRIFFLATFQRVILPAQAVSWADFLLADMLCSLSKSCADFSRAVCWLATGPVMQELAIPSFKPSGMCAPTAAPQLLALCLPYLIRFVQCFIVLRTTGKGAQAWNAAKYFSGLPVLLLSAFEHEAHTANRTFPWRSTWLLACSFNSLFSYYWDVEQDWKMPWLWSAWTKAQQRKWRGLSPGASMVSLVAASAKRPATLAPPPTVAHLNSSSSIGAVVAHHAKNKRPSSPGCLPLLHPQALHLPKAWYVRALCSNLVLRLLWMHRLMGRLEANEGLELLLALAEVWRRHQWVHVRIEAELRQLAAIYSAWPGSPSRGRLSAPLAWDQGPPTALVLGEGRDKQLQGGTDARGGTTVEEPAALLHRHGWELQDGPEPLMQQPQRGGHGAHQHLVHDKPHYPQQHQQLHLPQQQHEAQHPQHHVQQQQQQDQRQDQQQQQSLPDTRYVFQGLVAAPGHKEGAQIKLQHKLLMVPLYNPEKDARPAKISPISP